MNQRRLDERQARLNLTWQGQNGDVLEGVPFDASDVELKAIALEALRGGDIAGIDPDPRAVLVDFVVDRFPATEEMPVNRVFIRPKTPFG